MTKPVEVTKADRDARKSVHVAICQAFIEGRQDAWPKVDEAFARHRHEATRELVEEITRLRAENERLREVLLWLNQNVSGYGADHIICHTCVEVENLARTALQETGGE